jgi:BRCA2, oligonucleotide/oligosaccharide-binding, domain 1/BRCA2, helical
MGGAAATSSWSCASCTLENPSGKRRCLVCGHRRPLEAAAAAAAAAATMTPPRRGRKRRRSMETAPSATPPITVAPSSPPLPLSSPPLSSDRTSPEPDPDQVTEPTAAAAPVFFYTPATQCWSQEVPCSVLLANKSTSTTDPVSANGQSETAGQRGTTHVWDLPLVSALPADAVKSTASLATVKSTKEESNDRCMTVGQPCQEETETKMAFRTDGKQTTLDVTAASLKASALLNDPAESATRLTAVNSNAITRQGTGDGLPTVEESKVGRQGMNMDRRCQEEMHTVMNESTGPKMTGFQTAGKQTTIQVAAASLTKAKALFSDPADPAVNDLPAAPMTGEKLDPRASLLPNQATEETSLVSRANDGWGSAKDELTGTKMVGFQTAGKQTTIQVAAASLAKAKALLNDPDNSATCLTAVHSTAIARRELDTGACLPTGASLPPANIALKKSQVGRQGMNVGRFVQEEMHTVMNEATGPTMAGFQTAGKQTTIEVAAASLAKANALLADPAESAMCATAVNSTITREELGSGACLPAVSLPPASKDESYVGRKDMNVGRAKIAGFQTAGKKTTIQVAAASLAKADALLNDPGESSTSWTAVNSTITREELDTVPGLPTAVSLPPASKDESNVGRKDMNAGRAKIAGFQTAGKKTTIHVTAASLAKASALLNDPGESSTSWTAVNSTITREELGSDAGLPIAASLPPASKDESNVGRKDMNVGRPFQEEMHTLMNNSTGAKMAGFQTAGKRTDLFDDLAEPTTRFNDFPAAPIAQEGSDTRASLPPNYTAEETSFGDSQNVTRLCQEEPYNAMNASTGAKMAGFQTAGKQSTIRVAAASLAKATALLDDPAECTTSATAVNPPAIARHDTVACLPTVSLPAASIALDEFNVCRKGVNVGRPFQEEMNTLMNDSTGTKMAGFQTAGKRTTIQVAAASLAKARALFNDLAEPTIHFNDLAAAPMAQEEPGARASLPQNQTPEETSLVSRANVGWGSAKDGLTGAKMAVFQTAGKQTTIQVAAASLVKASALLNDQVEPRIRFNDMSTLPMAQGGSDTRGSWPPTEETSWISPANDSWEGSSVNLGPSRQDAIDYSTGPGFQTAGKHTSIQVAAASLAKAEALLNDPAESAAGSATLNLATMVPKEIDRAVSWCPPEKKSKTFESVAESKIGTRTETRPGSASETGQSSVEESGLPIGSCPDVGALMGFSCFQPGGKQAVIPFSASSLIKAQALLGDDRDSSTASALSGTEKSTFSLSSKARAPAEIDPNASPVVGSARLQPGSSLKAREPSIPWTEDHVGWERAMRFSRQPPKRGHEMHHDARLVNESAVTMALFQSAGNRAPIHVSAASLAKAKTLLSDRLESTGCSSALNLVTMAPQEGDKGVFEQAQEIGSETLLVIHERRPTTSHWAESRTMIGELSTDGCLDQLQPSAINDTSLVVTTTALIPCPGTGTRQNEEEVESTGPRKENSQDESRSRFESTTLRLAPKTALSFTATSDDVVTQRFHRVSLGEGPCCVSPFSCGPPDDENLESPLEVLTPCPCALPLSVDGSSDFATSSRETRDCCEMLETDVNFASSLRKAFQSGQMTEEAGTALFDGVSPLILQLTGGNALFAVFDLNCGFVTGIGNDWPKSQTDSVFKFFASVRLKCTSVTEKWIKNHARWIIWKLASLERKFSSFLAGKCLTFEELLRRLRVRHIAEFTNGYRSPLRKILNKDVSSTSMMILCVARILYPSDQSHSKLVALELTDGWYSVVGHVDMFLDSKVRSGCVDVGSKLLISCAIMRGGGDGVDPLDDSFHADLQTVYIQLCANSTRIARWNARLGFVTRPPPSSTSDGLLLVRSLADVVECGGPIPLIDLLILERYPLLFLERQPILEGDSGQKARSTVLTETEKNERSDAAERSKQVRSEAIWEEVLEECIKVRATRYLSLCRSAVARSHAVFAVSRRSTARRLTSCAIFCRSAMFMKRQRSLPHATKAYYKIGTRNAKR